MYSQSCGLHFTVNDHQKMAVVGLLKNKSLIFCIKFKINDFEQRFTELSGNGLRATIACECVGFVSRCA